MAKNSTGRVFVLSCLPATPSVPPVAVPRGPLGAAARDPARRSGSPHRRRRFSQALRGKPTAAGCRCRWPAAVAGEAALRGKQVAVLPAAAYGGCRDASAAWEGGSGGRRGNSQALMRRPRGSVPPSVPPSAPPGRHALPTALPARPGQRSRPAEALCTLLEETARWRLDALPLAAVVAQIAALEAGELLGLAAAAVRKPTVRMRQGFSPVSAQPLRSSSGVCCSPLRSKKYVPFGITWA